MKNILSINESYVFNRTFNRGLKFITPSIIIYLHKNNYGVNRLGIITSKKIGNAVIRNRARRIIRHAYLQLRNDIKIGYDIICISRLRTVTYNSISVHKDMLFGLRKLRI